MWLELGCPEVSERVSELFPRKCVKPYADDECDEYTRNQFMRQFPQTIAAKYSRLCGGVYPGVRLTAPEKQTAQHEGSNSTILVKTFGLYLLTNISACRKGKYLYCILDAA